MCDFFSSIIYIWNVIFHIFQCSWCIFTFCAVRAVHGCNYISTLNWFSIAIRFCIEDWTTLLIFLVCRIYLCTICFCVNYWRYRVICGYLIIYTYSDCTHTIICCFTRYNRCTSTYEFHFVSIFHSFRVSLT